MAKTKRDGVAELSIVLFSNETIRIPPQNAKVSSNGMLLTS